MNDTVYELLKNQYKELFESDYYADILCSPSTTLNKLWCTLNIHKIINVKAYLSKVSLVRQMHIINVCLLGHAMMKELLKEKDITQMKRNWTFMSLAHDIGYLSEENESVNFSCLNDYINSKGLDNIFCHSDNCQFYSNETYKNYFKYIAEVFNKYEHGIVGALEIWSRKQLFPNYDINNICYMIASHNVFLSEKDIYLKYGLSELLIGNRNCIILPRSLNIIGKMYIILIICDILEPINILDYCLPNENKHYLDSISYRFSSHSLVIKGEEKYINIIYNRISDMGRWLNVDVNLLQSTICVSWQNTND